MSERLDKEMLSRKMVSTRSQARMLIEQGDVKVNGERASKAGQLVASQDLITIDEKKLYVGRGAYKLEKALDDFQVDLEGLSVIDVGASTGGFTQVCLERGARKVFAVDVGKDQLAQVLKDDERVVNLEGVNAKHPLPLEEKADVFVMDVSFISLRHVVLNAFSALREGGLGVVLIKPQFEAGPKRVGKNGLVSEADREDILQETLAWFKENGLVAEKIIDSPIRGAKTGNLEWLALVKKAFRSSVSV